MAQVTSPTLVVGQDGDASDLLKGMVAACSRFMKSYPIGMGAVVLLLALFTLAVFAEQIAPYDPLTNNYSALDQPPSAAHWMGTDYLGRDVLSRVIYGLQVSLLVSIASVVLGVSCLLYTSPSPRDGLLS